MGGGHSAGFALSHSETTDSFGTEVTTKQPRSLLCAPGYRWFSSCRSGRDRPRCQARLGRRRHLPQGTHPDHPVLQRADFSSELQPPRNFQLGLFPGVLGADLMLAPKLHLVIETRLDGVYLKREVRTVQEDSFGGEFEQSDSGWEAQLNAPLSLVCGVGLV